MKTLNLLLLVPLTLLLACGSNAPGSSGTSAATDTLTVTNERGLPQEGPPVLLSMQPVVYPEMAREARTEGTVIVRVLVNTEGAVKEVEVVQSVLGLDEAAINTAWTARFKPGQENGQPVEAWMVLPTEFTLP